MNPTLYYIVYADGEESSALADGITIEGGVATFYLDFKKHLMLGAGQWKSIVREAE